MEILWSSFHGDLKKKVMNQKVSTGNFLDRSQHNTPENPQLNNGFFFLIIFEAAKPTYFLKTGGLGILPGAYGRFLTPAHFTPTDAYNKKKVLLHCFHSEGERACSYHRCKNLEWDLSVLQRGMQPGIRKLPGSLSFLSETQSYDAASQFTPPASISLMPPLVTPTEGFHGWESP